MRNDFKRPGSKSTFSSARDQLARVLAAGATFFGTGPAFVASADLIGDFVTNTYGSSLVGISLVFWFVFLVIVIFAVSTLVITTLINFLILLGADVLSR